VVLLRQSAASTLLAPDSDANPPTPRIHPPQFTLEAASLFHSSDSRQLNTGPARRCVPLRHPPGQTRLASPTKPLTSPLYTHRCPTNTCLVARWTSCKARGAHRVHPGPFPYRTAYSPSLRVSTRILHLIFSTLYLIRLYLERDPQKLTTILYFSPVLPDAGLPAKYTTFLLRLSFAQLRRLETPLPTSTTKTRASST
jgi:hypothetical protein